MLFLFVFVYDFSALGDSGLFDTVLKSKGEKIIEILEGAILFV